MPNSKRYKVLKSTQHNSIFLCKCGKIYNSEFASKLHCKVSHNNDILWITHDETDVCLVCGFKCSNSATISRHRQDAHRF